jgi:hypothetical protein
LEKQQIDGVVKGFIGFREDTANAQTSKFNCKTLIGALVSSQTCLILFGTTYLAL